MNFTTLSINLLAIPSIQGQWELTKAKKAYLKQFPECAICGNNKSLEVHHIVPVHIDPNIATSEKNFITLCDISNQSCHRWFGHLGDFKNKYNLQIREFAIFTRWFIESKDSTRKFIIPTETMICSFAESMRLNRVEFIDKVKELSTVFSRSN